MHDRFRDYTVQELIIEAHNTRYRLAIWKTPTGKYLKGKLPEEVRDLGHNARNAQKLPSLSIPSLPCYPTQAPRTGVISSNK